VNFLEKYQVSENFDELIHDFVQKYIEVVESGFESRWSQIKPEIYHNYIHECIGALLSRQATLTIEMAKAPSTWNGHVAPLFLRCMIDAYIALAWILEKPKERSKKYILYGLGQEKLFIEYLEKALNEEPDAYDAESLKQMIKIRKAWLNSQLAEWATEVNVGSWSGMSTREMAKEIGRESIYQYAYVPFSGPVHNMWQHVGIYNVHQCLNPLHKFHLVPKIQHAPIHPDFMYRSAKYMAITFEIFDKKMGTKSDVILPDVFLLSHPLFAVDDGDS